MTSDAELLRGFTLEHDENAFESLVVRYVDLVYSTALRLLNNDAHLAEDVAQKVFTDFARKASSLAHEVRLAGWFYEATRFTAAKTIRGEQRRRAREQEATAMQDLASDAARNWEEIAPHLDAAMAELKDVDRDAILLRFFQDRDFRSIGQFLGLSHNAAQKRVSRAIDRLRERLLRRGVTVGAGGLGMLISTHAVHAAPASIAGSLKGTAILKAAIELGVAESSVSSFFSLKAIATAVVAGLIVTGAVLGLRPGAASLRLPVGAGTAKVSMGGMHGIILASDGSLWSWGENFGGWPVLGSGAVDKQPKLSRIGPDRDWVDVSTSFSHGLALKADGSVWAWGENLHGELGLGTAGAAITERTVPTRTLAGKDWSQVAAGGSHSLALKNNGTLWAWGNNWAGQLGIGETNSEVWQPTQVGESTNWSRIWASGVQSVGLRSDGSLWFWGSLTGSASDTNRYLVPTRVSADADWREVGFGYFLVFGIKTNGTLWAWGRNAGIYTKAPIQVLNATPERVGTENDWEECSKSEYFYHVLRKKDGSLWEMDASEHSNVNRLNPNAVTVRRVPLTNDFVAFGSAGRGRTGVAMTTEGEVWTWGKVLGQSAGAYPRLRKLANAVGWQTTRFDGKPIDRKDPWPIPRE